MGVYPTLAPPRDKSELTVSNKKHNVNIMKTKPARRAPNTISTDEIRCKFYRLLRAVKAGRSLTLTYRNRPLARIVPLQTEIEVSQNDPIFRLHEIAGGIGPLTNEEIDAIIYGERSFD
jgi:prevent-host-death family protein